MSEETIQLEAGEDIQPGQMIYVSLVDGKAYVCVSQDDYEHAAFTIGRHVSKGDVMNLTPHHIDPPGIYIIEHKDGSPLNDKAWAVIYDMLHGGNASCDLTYQEAQQMLIALKESGCKGLTIVTNAVGKRAQEQGFVRSPDQN